MKYKLCYNTGYPYNRYTVDWDLLIDARAIDTSGSIQIERITDHYDYIYVALSEIPVRVDLESDGTAWLLDKKGVELHPKPIKLLSKYTSKTIFTYGEREALTLEEIGV